MSSYEELVYRAYRLDDNMFDCVPTGEKIVRCKNCKFRHDGLQAVVDGETKTVTEPRCSRMFGFVDDNGWCYKGERK